MHEPDINVAPQTNGKLHCNLHQARKPYKKIIHIRIRGERTCGVMRAIMMMMNTAFFWKHCDYPLDVFFSRSREFPSSPLVHITQDPHTPSLDTCYAKVQNWFHWTKMLNDFVISLLVDVLCAFSILSLKILDFDSCSTSSVSRHNLFQA